MLCMYVCNGYFLECLRIVIKWFCCVPILWELYRGRRVTYVDVRGCMCVRKRIRMYAYIHPLKFSAYWEWCNKIEGENDMGESCKKMYVYFTCTRVCVYFRQLGTWRRSVTYVRICTLCVCIYVHISICISVCKCTGDKSRGAGLTVCESFL